MKVNNKLIQVDVPSQLQIDIDWLDFIKSRSAVLKNSEDIPQYLLLPEIHLILQNIKDVGLHLFVNTLWHFGLKISEILKLTISDFILGSSGENYLSISSERLIPFNDGSYKKELLHYCSTNELSSSDLIFPFVRFTYNKQLERLQALLSDESGITLPFKLTPQLLRNSFAVNCLIHRVLLTEIQSYLGHKHITETKLYTQIFIGKSNKQIWQVIF